MAKSAKDYAELASRIVELIGGKDNIAVVLVKPFSGEVKE